MRLSKLAVYVCTNVVCNTVIGAVAEVPFKKHCAALHDFVAADAESILALCSSHLDRAGLPLLALFLVNSYAVHAASAAHLSAHFLFASSAPTPSINSTKDGSTLLWALRQQPPSRVHLNSGVSRAGCCAGVGASVGAGVDTAGLHVFHLEAARFLAHSHSACRRHFLAPTIDEQMGDAAESDGAGPREPASASTQVL